MFLGQIVSHTRSGDTLTGFNNAQVGAIHISQTGYTSVTVTGTGVNATFTLQDGYNLLLFNNTRTTNLTLSWTGTGSVTWSTLGVFTTDIALFDLHELPTKFSPVFSFPEDFQYATPTSISGQLGFEWRNLPWNKVDELEVLFDRHGVLNDPSFVLIPQEFDSARYNVIMTSPFDFYQSVDGNFHNGASGAIVFRTID